MKTFGKFLGLLVLGLLLALVALGFAVTQLFDPNDYKEEIRQLARDKANLELDLKGKIGWSLFPWLGLELHDATLASANSPQQPFAELDMLGLSVRVLPLLHREVQMSDIRVDGLKLSLERDAKGHGNWEDIGRPAQAASGAPAGSAKQPSDAAEAPPAEESAKAAPALRLDIDSLAMSNARIDYHDAATGQRYTLEGLDLRSGAIREGASIPLTLKGYFGTNQPVLRARGELTGKLRFDTALKRYWLEDAQLKGDLSGAPLDNQSLAFDLQGQLHADLAAQVAEWNHLKLSANQLNLLGELKARELDRTPQVEGRLSIAEFDLRALLEGLGQKLPPMADGNALRHVALASSLSATPTSLSLQDLKLQLDGSNLEGRLGIADFARQSLRAQLKGDRLDLDRYLPPPAKEADAASATRKAEVADVAKSSPGAGNTPLPQQPTSNAWSEETLLPLASLRKLDADIALSLAQLTLHKLPMENTSLKLKANGGRIRLEELRGNLFDGRFALTGSLDARSDTPQLLFEPQLGNIPLQRLLETLKPEEKSPVRGKLQLEGRLNASGNSERALIDSLGGTASFILDDGALADANLEQQLCLAIATLNRKVPSRSIDAKDTPLNEMRGSLQFNRGVASNRDLRASIPGLTVNGQGDVDLRVLSLDYRVGVVIDGDRREMPDPACQVNERYVGLEWPLRCRGPLELGARACRMDQNGLGSIAAKLAGEKLTEKLDEKLGDKVSPELKDALKNLFQR